MEPAEDRLDDISLNGCMNSIGHPQQWSQPKIGWMTGGKSGGSLLDTGQQWSQPKIGWMTSANEAAERAHYLQQWSQPKIGWMTAREI